MEKWVLLYLAFFNLKALAQDTWLGIDCGSETGISTLAGVWQTDEPFINTGTNQFVSSDNFQTFALLNTLRAFTTQNKNCYELPAQASTRYFIRAIFLYGNYDGLSNPPTFDLVIDGNKWMTVDSSSGEILHYEIIYTSNGDVINVCLARTEQDQFPFISSLEAWPILDNKAYIHMSRDVAWLNSYRYNYGSNDWILGYPDKYYRIWEPKAQFGMVNTSADLGTILTSTPYEYPPDSAVLDAIEAQNANDSIILSFGQKNANDLNYIEAYFTEMSFNEVTERREFGFYVDNQQVAIVSPEYGSCTGVWALAQFSSGSLTIKLRPTDISTLPPIISAIEVYTASDPLVTTTTSQNDIDGLEVLKSTFEQLKGWSGEPCLPRNTVWEWLSCTGNNPPRVTSINLSGHNLSGKVPDFSQMQALESIDFSNNNLNGQIPEFLGDLPNLKTLDLRNNDFSGQIPSSMSDNKRITYYIEGNPNLDASHKNKSTSALIIGLSVGLSVFVILILMALLYWLIRRRASQGQNQEIGTESGGPQVGQGSPPKISTEQEMQPNPQPSAPMVPSTEEDFKQNSDDDYVVVGDSYTIHQSMVPEMDLEELGEIIKQHENNTQNDFNDEHGKSSSHETEIPVSAHINEQSMAPEWDLEELEEHIEKETGGNDKSHNTRKS